MEQKDNLGVVFGEGPTEGPFEPLATLIGSPLTELCFDSVVKDGLVHHDYEHICAPFVILSFDLASYNVQRQRIGKRGTT